MVRIVTHYIISLWSKSHHSFLSLFLGETIPYQLADLTVTTEIEEENDRVLILWPVTIAHKIDEDSPLYDMNPRDILNSQFEVIMTLEGVTEETGNTVQVRLDFDKK